MPGRYRRLTMTLGLAGLLLACAPSVAEAATPVQDPVPIGPGQFFSGLVNGSYGSPGPVAIRTNCFGPIQPGQTGNPLPGQTVEVVLTNPAASIQGYTGTAANSIIAYLGFPTPTQPPVQQVAKFTSYFVTEAIPVTLTVPCSGNGAMSFVPSPGSPTAHPATVQVFFQSQP